MLEFERIERHLSSSINFSLRFLASFPLQTSWTYQFRKDFVSGPYNWQDKHEVEQEHDGNRDGTNLDLRVDPQLCGDLMVLKVYTRPQHEHSS